MVATTYRSAARLGLCIPSSTPLDVERESAMNSEVDTIVTAIKSGTWSTEDLVRLAYAVGAFGKNGTSILGQHGEELVARAFGGTVASFDTKAYDVRTPHDGDLQVKTFSVGKRPGNIRSFTHDVVALEIDPQTASVVSAQRYAATDLFAAFRAIYTDKYAMLGMTWGGSQADRFERSWSIPRGLRFADITHMFAPQRT
jgi:hypothetical protein